MIIIPTPTQSFASHKVSLAGLTYDFTFRYNTFQGMWYLDIYLNNAAVILGQALLPTNVLFYGKPIKNFDHGVLMVLRNVDTTEPLGRDNLGVSKLYSLYYLSNEEWNEILNG
jgi:hypothetical protein